MVYLKLMKEDGTFQLLESSGYIEFIKNKVDGSVKCVYQTIDSFGDIKEWNTWLTGDAYMINESGVTISHYKFHPV
ncbi:hypothetical protein ACT414_18335 (plasmid) [Acinetobacter baumannii]